MLILVAQCPFCAGRRVGRLRRFSAGKRFFGKMAPWKSSGCVKGRFPRRPGRAPLPADGHFSQDAFHDLGGRHAVHVGLVVEQQPVAGQLFRVEKSESLDEIKVLPVEGVEFRPVGQGKGGNQSVGHAEAQVVVANHELGKLPGGGDINVKQPETVDFLGSASFLDPCIP